MAGRKPLNRRLLERRRVAIRKSISGTAAQPRLSIRRSIKHIYAQLIDDDAGQTLAAASSVSLKIPGATIDDAKAVGKAIAENAKKNSIERVCFDRGGRRYHGRLKALADAARKGGLQF